MMVRRRRDIEGEHEYIVERESADSSMWWRLSWYLQKFMPLWAPLVIIGSTLGFTLITPKRAADELRSHSDSLAMIMQAQLNIVKADQLSLHQTHDSLSHDMSLLVRMACLQKSVTAYDKRLVGLLDAAGECIR